MRLAREDAEARRRSTGILLVAVLAVPSAIALAQGWLGGAPLSGRAELGVGIFFVTAASAAVIAGLWAHQGVAQRTTDASGRAGAPRATPRHDDGWVRIPVERDGTQAPSSRPARTRKARVQERRPPAG
jgi:hypothetical protein